MLQYFYITTSFDLWGEIRIIIFVQYLFNMGYSRETIVFEIFTQSWFIQIIFVLLQQPGGLKMIQPLRWPKSLKKKHINILYFVLTESLLQFCIFFFVLFRASCSGMKEKFVNVQCLLFSNNLGRSSAIVKSLYVPAKILCQACFFFTSTILIEIGYRYPKEVIYSILYTDVFVARDFLLITSLYYGYRYNTLQRKYNANLIRIQFLYVNRFGAL